MSKYFINWWIIFVLLVFVSALSYVLGFVDLIIRVDVTKLSIVIYVLLIIFSVKTGNDSYKLYKFTKNNCIGSISDIERSQDITWFVSDLMLTLGMLGTIIGYIYMIHVGFSSIDPSSVSSMMESLKIMAVGWGTALYTTAIGLVSSLILKIQLFNITKLIEKIQNTCVNVSSDKTPLGGMV